MTPSARESCDLCGGRSGRVLFETAERRFGLGGHFAVVACRCGLVRTEPKPADVSAFYPSEDYYSYGPPSPPGSLTLERARLAGGLPTAGRISGLVARVFASRLGPGLPDTRPGKILDVGCGSGETLLVLRELGWDVHGIELAAAAVAQARRAGLNQVRHGDLLDAAFAQEAFDVVRFWHSLEHVASPRAQLREAHRVLRPGGRLIVGVPNFGSLLSRVLERRWFALDVPRHLWHFDRRTLGRLAAAAGFTQILVRFSSTGDTLLGSLSHGAPATVQRALSSPAAWYATLPLAALADVARLGDALELRAVTSPRDSSPAA